MKPANEKTTSGDAEAVSRRTFLSNATMAVAGAVATSGTIEAQGRTDMQRNANGEHMTPNEEAIKAAKIRRALLSGPASITKDATVIEMDHAGKPIVLRQGTNEWICMPGDENKIGDVPMCADPVAMQWFSDARARKPKPTNAVPGICYMLCGASQRSNTDPYDQTSPPIPIGPHWMILWPFDAKTSGFPTTVRDQGAWIMFADTPYAYLHVCGSPWDGNEYKEGEEAIWTMSYPKKS